MPLDPHARRFLDRLAAMNPPGALSLTVPERRRGVEQLLRLSGPPASVGDIVESAVPGPAGKLRLRIYSPDGSDRGVLPGFIFLHGGGLVAGSLDSHDPVCRALTSASRCRLLAVDYRLAPEHRFPAAIDDCIAAVHGIVARAAQFGIDAGQVVLGGDSAGATLAAVVCQQLSARADVRIALQFLLCPITDWGADSESRRRFRDGYLLDQGTLDHDLRFYLGNGDDPRDPRVSPLRAERLVGLPPACIHTAQFDPVHDEGLAYAEKLRQAGVATRYRCHAGMIHLFYGLGAVIPRAAAAFQLMGDDIRTMLDAVTVK